jgi:hypothetical protein
MEHLPLTACPYPGTVYFVPVAGRKPAALRTAYISPARVEWRLSSQSPAFVFDVAFVIRGLGWLRTLALTSVAWVALYFYSLPVPLLAVVYWNVFYRVLNSRWIGWLMRWRRAAEA